MQQVFQNLKTGETEFVDVPCPQVQPGTLLIRSCASVISAGTERMLVEFSRANLLDKARQQPDKVRQTLDKIRTDGLLPTLDAVRARLDQLLPLGYCNAGVVLEVGAGVEGWAPGDRVVSNGYHAEVVCVPQNLCVKIPAGVTDEAAAFTVLGAIGLQGVRLAGPTLGEFFAVTGLGLVGQLVVQILQAHGCRVLGIDVDPERLALARTFGIETVDLSKGEDPISASTVFSHGRGIDGVLITASTTSNEPVHQAAQMCRKRGRIVLVGVTGLALSRADFYEKELTFQVSCSYGPGRYDPAYEGQGQDYPLGFVRWTEQRNFEAVLDLLHAGSLNVAPLISHRFPAERAADAYSAMSAGGASLGIVLQYRQVEDDDAASKALRDATVHLRTVSEPTVSSASAIPIVGVVGAGGFATQVLLPALRDTPVRLKSVASASGMSGMYASRKFSIPEATVDTSRIFDDPEIDTVVIATRHDSHARFTCQALRSGKHVFVEKPLALNAVELDDIEATVTALKHDGTCPMLMVGFNRRFAPHVRKMKELLASVHEPKSFLMTVNAGAIPPNHWTQDPNIGGGRMIGEGCHFIDLLRFLVGAPIVKVQATMIGQAPGVSVRGDKVSFSLSFADGSLGTVLYLASGHRTFPKERLEVFCAGRVLQLDNFRRLRGYGWPGFNKRSSWRQDKGHRAEIEAFVQAIQNGGPAPIPFEELVEVTRASFAVVEAANR